MPALGSMIGYIVVNASRHINIQLYWHAQATIMHNVIIHYYVPRQASELVLKPLERTVWSATACAYVVAVVYVACRSPSPFSLT